MRHLHTESPSSQRRACLHIERAIAAAEGSYLIGRSTTPHDDSSRAPGGYSTPIERGSRRQANISIKRVDTLHLACAPLIMDQA